MAKTKEIKSLKPEFAKLERDEPWTPHERTSFPARQKTFIRGIQITHGMNKQEAIDYFGRMNTRSKSDFKHLERTVKKRLEKYASSDSGGKRVHEIFTTNDLKREQKRLGLKAKPKEKQKVEKQKVKAENYSSVKAWLSSKQTKKEVSPKMYQRVKSGAEKYPFASKFELQHGVNSKASQNYRVNHGRPKKFEYASVK